MTLKARKLAQIDKLSLSFGVEIECYAPSHASSNPRQFAARVLQDAGLEAVDTGYTHQVTRYWKIVSDASLGRNGVEVVSPILYGDLGMHDLKTAIKALKENGFTVNTTTGTHVHFGIEGAPLKHVKAFAKTYLRYEHVIDWMVGKSRRGNSNGMIKSHTLGGRKDITDGRFTRINDARNMNDLIDAVSNGDRYYKLNLASWNRQRTMEVRHFGGSLNATKIENWILLLDAMWRLAYVYAPTPLTKNVTKSAESAYSFFKQSLNFEPELAEYWHNRIKKNLASERRLATLARQEQRRIRARSERR